MDRSKNKTVAARQTCSKSGPSESNPFKIGSSAQAEGREVSSKETILIFRTGSLGDTIVALPCFHWIARSFPESRRIVLTNTPVSEKAAPLESILANTGLI